MSGFSSTVKESADMGSWICLIMNCSCDGPVMLLMIDQWGWWNLKRGTLPLKICKFRPSTQWELQQISAWISILPVRVMRMWHSPWHISVNHTSEVHSHSLKHSSSYRSLMIFSHYLTWPAIGCTSIPHTISTTKSLYNNIAGRLLSHQPVLSVPMLGAPLFIHCQYSCK